MKPISKKRLSDQVVERIVSLIENGKLKIGDKLPSEQALMQQFGVGRGTIREAKQALSLVGILDPRSGYGTLIVAPQLSLLEREWGKYVRYDKVEELIEARIALEETVVSLAARKADKQDLTELGRILDQIKANKNNKKKIVQLDLLFHASLAQASHNSVVLKMLQLIRPLINAWMKQVTPFIANTDINLLINEHGEILNEIEKKDVNKARLAMRRHLERSSRRLALHLLGRQVKKEFQIGLYPENRST